MGLTLTAIALALSACANAGTPGHWSGPITISAGAPLYDVSCPTPSSCVAVGGGGSSVAMTGAAWSAPTPITGSSTSQDAAPVAISCVIDFCAAALSNGDLPLYDGTAWRTSGAVDTSGELASVSCPTAQFCAAVDDSGQVLMYRGTWSAPATIDSGGDLESVSCTSPTFCMTVSSDSPATVYLFNGSRWSSIDAPNPSTPQGGSEPNTLSWVSCATSKYCVALDDFGEAFTWNGTWSGGITFDSNVLDGSDAVSCASRDFCMIVDDTGLAVTLSNGSLGTSHQVDSSNVGLASVSCPTATKCVAVGDKGRVYEFSG